MEVSQKILDTLSNLKIYEADGICYLLCLFHGYEPTYIPESLIIRMNATGIYEKRDGNIHWNFPLYDNQITAFDWVKTEYIPLFKAVNSERGGHIRESTTRLKRFFAENPDVRKDDVINATKLYLSKTDRRYIMNPHYFIHKGVGVNKTCELMNWIERYRALATEARGRNSHTNTLK